MRFQLYPMTAFNELIIHVRLNDSNANWQQEALGIIGVNLIYSCFHSRDPDKLTRSLIDNLDKERVEVDMFKISGPDFKHIDNRLLSLLLVKNGLSKLAMFDQDGNVQQPSEALYKKNVLILRGRFKPVTHVNVDMMITGFRQFRKEPDIDKQNIVALAELNLHDLKKANDDIDLSEYLQTADLLNSLEQNVIISGYKEYYKLVNYMAQFTRSFKMGIILGIYNLHSVFDESYYSELYGGILEAFGILFGKNIKLYVYPSQKRDTKEIYEFKDFEIPSNLQPLLKYLVSNNKIEGSLAYKKENLDIISDDVLEMIKKRVSGWEEFVPNKVADAIKSQGMFNYKPPVDSVKAKF